MKHQVYIKINISAYYSTASQNTQSKTTVPFVRQTMIPAVNTLLELIYVVMFEKNITASIILCKLMF